MTSDEIKELYTMSDMLTRYRLPQPNRKGFICCPFHKENTPSMQIFERDFRCFGCGINGDIFTFVMRMDGLEFKEAFRELGGSYQDGNKMSFSGYMKLISAVKKRKTAIVKEKRIKLDYQLNNKLISVYRHWLNKSEPLSDVWCSCYNALQYQIYLSGYFDEKR